MGTWSAQPIGNDVAADFVADLDGQARWNTVKQALTAAERAGARIDDDVAATAIAAAEVVAHGLGRPSQTDAYTDGIRQFVGRARRPSRRLADRAARAVEAAARPGGDLAESWAEAGQDEEWQESVDRLMVNLRP